MHRPGVLTPSRARKLASPAAKLSRRTDSYLVAKDKVGRLSMFFFGTCLDELCGSEIYCKAAADATQLAFFGVCFRHAKQPRTK